jgi:hypothetical protein
LLQASRNRSASVCAAALSSGVISLGCLNGVVIRGPLDQSPNPDMDSRDQSACLVPRKIPSSQGAMHDEALTLPAASAASGVFRDRNIQQGKRDGGRRLSWWDSRQKPA